MAWTASGEGDPGGDGGEFEGAQLGAAVAAFAGVEGGRGLLPTAYFGRA
jgi:hypothetical protein